MAVSLLLVGIAAGAAGFASGRRLDTRRIADAVLRLLFWTGAPLTALVATSTRLDLHLLSGLAASWAALGLSLAATLVLTRGAEGPRRAETVLAVCWPNAGWLGVPATVIVFGWDALPLAIAFGQLVSGPFCQMVVPGVAAGLAHAEGRGAGRLRASLRNPYLPCLVAGYAAATAGLTPPAAVSDVVRWLLLATTVPAFAAVGATLGGQAIAPGRSAVRLALARLTFASVPLFAFALVLPVPAPFILLAAMSTGMSTVSVAAAFRIPTERLAPALALTTALVLVMLAAVPLVDAL